MERVGLLGLWRVPNERQGKLCLLVLIAAFLFALRPYSGIRHDAVYYLGQGLLSLYPEDFSSDLFFAYGGQANFTIFPRVLGWLLGLLPASELFEWATLLGRVALLGASWVLLRILFRGWARYLALFALVILPGSYGGNAVFSYGEPFFTARTMAEPLCLLALASLLSRRYFLMLLLWGAAAALHPLQAFAAAIVIWSWFYLEDRRWGYILPAMILCLAGVYFFSERGAFLFQQYDEDWLRWMEAPNHNVFLINWSVGSWFGLGLDTSLLFLMYRISAGPMKKLCAAMLLALSLGLGGSLILADFLSLVFPTGLQLWRVQWLAHWAAMASIPVLLFKIGNGQFGKERALLLLAAIVWALPGGYIAPSPWPALLVGALFLAWPLLVEKIRPQLRKLLMVAVAASLVLGAIKFLLFVYLVFLKQGGEFAGYRLDSIILAYPLISIALAGTACWAWGVGGAYARGVTFLLVLLFLFYAIFNWDSRSTWNVYVEEAAGVNPFGVKIEPGAQVYWAGELLAPWSVLHRPSYFNEGQQAGLLFSRETARQASIRGSVTRILEFQASICDVVNAAAGSMTCAPDLYTVKEICEASEGGLSYVVLSSPLETPPLGVWKIPKVSQSEAEVSYYLYGCAGLRAHASLGGQ